MIAIIALVMCLCMAHSLAAGSSAQEVTCQSTIKLRNTKSRFYLHSHDIPYGSGSGQQSVTGTSEGDEAGSYWEIQGSLEEPCEQQSPIKKNQIIRMHHVTTGKWLHSHNLASPLSQNAEVSAYGAPTKSDSGDYWMVSWDGSSKTWQRDAKVYFQHVDTKRWLTDTGKSYSRPISGQHEVACIAKKDQSTAWQAAEGMYLHQATAKGATMESSDEL